MLQWNTEKPDHFKIDKTLIYDYIDEGLLSTSWGDTATIDDIGFGTPLQFKEYKESCEAGLSMCQKSQLLDPKGNGEKLEWLIAECLEKQAIPQRILCFQQKTPARHEGQELIHWKSFSVPKHLNIMMKPFPDSYGTGKMQFSDLTITDLIKFTEDANGVTVHLIQIKLGTYMKYYLLILKVVRD